MRFNEVPVGCVEPGWLSEVFIPATADKLTTDRSAVFLMPTDSHRESEFLCARLAQSLGQEYGKQVGEIHLNPADPTLFWEALFGLPDTGPTFDYHLRCDILVIRGGNYLPQWFVDDHIDFLIAIAFAFNPGLFTRSLLIIAA